MIKFCVVSYEIMQQIGFVCVIYLYNDSAVVPSSKSAVCGKKFNMVQMKFNIEKNN